MCAVSVARRKQVGRTRGLLRHGRPATTRQKTGTAGLEAERPSVRSRRGQGAASLDGSETHGMVRCATLLQPSPFSAETIPRLLIFLPNPPASLTPLPQPPRASQNKSNTLRRARVCVMCVHGISLAVLDELKLLNEFGEMRLWKKKREEK